MPLVAVPDGALQADMLTVHPWPDDVIDNLGHDPRSHYVEQFWLGILGPSATWLLRRLAAGLEANATGFDLVLGETARELGLGHMGGRHSPFVRSIGRLCQFELARPVGDGVLAVRRKVPPLNRRQVTRLPDGLRAAHERWQEEQLHTPLQEQLERRARQLALSLFELGEDVEAAERQLLRWRFHPSMARQAIAWGWARHSEALAATTDATGRHPSALRLVSCTAEGDDG